MSPEEGGLVQPYVYVRAITISLGVMWTVGGWVRTVRFARRWSARLSIVGLTRKWFAKQIWIAVMRATILDPTNLTLLLILFGIWVFRALI